MSINFNNREIEIEKFAMGFTYSNLLTGKPTVSTPFFEPVINWKFKFAEISLSISKGLNYLAIDVDDLSCNLPSIAKTALLVG